MSTGEAGELRVVLDTNIYVSAFIGRNGTPFRTWRAALDRSYTLVTSPAIVNELGRILRTRFAWHDGRIIRRLKKVARAAEVVTPPFTLRAVAADASDNRILECAIAGQADLIVSGDRHLLDLKSFQNIPIIRPADFRRILPPRGGRHTKHPLE